MTAVAGDRVWLESIKEVTLSTGSINLHLLRSVFAEHHIGYKYPHLFCSSARSIHIPLSISLWPIFLPMFRTPFLPTWTSDLPCSWKFNLHCNPPTCRIRLWVYFPEISALGIQEIRVSFRVNRETLRAFVQHLNCGFELWAQPFLSPLCLVQWRSTNQSNSSH